MLDGESSSTPGQWRNVAVGAFAMLLPAAYCPCAKSWINEAGIEQVPAPRQELADPGAAAAAIRGRRWAADIVLAVTGLLGLESGGVSSSRTARFRSLAGYLPIVPQQIFVARFLTVLLFSAALVITMVPFCPRCWRRWSSGGMWHFGGGYSAARGRTRVVLRLGCFPAVRHGRGAGRALECAAGALVHTSLRVSPRAAGGCAVLRRSLRVGTSRLERTHHRALARALLGAAGMVPGLHQRLLGDGDAFYSAMAGARLIALAVAAAVMVVSYIVSYRRYRQLLVEAPVYIEIPARRREWSLFTLIAPRPQQQAVMQFLVKTLARSRADRTIWLAYVGAAIALMLNSSLIDGSHLTRRGVGMGVGLRFAILYWPLGLSVVLLAGIRHVFRLASCPPTGSSVSPKRRAQAVDAGRGALRPVLCPAARSTRSCFRSPSGRLDGDGDCAWVRCRY